MDVRRRNRIVSFASAVLSVVSLAFLMWAMWEVERRRSTWMFVLIGASGIAFMAWTWVGMRRDRRDLDQLARDAGINPDAVTEDPIPLIPPRGRRAELVTAIVILLLVAGAALANLLGWLDSFTPAGARR
jgi:hypothetical protein